MSSPEHAEAGPLQINITLYAQLSMQFAVRSSSVTLQQSTIACNDINLVKLTTHVWAFHPGLRRDPRLALLNTGHARARGLYMRCDHLIHIVSGSSGIAITVITMHDPVLFPEALCGCGKSL